MRTENLYQSWMRHGHFSLYQLLQNKRGGPGQQARQYEKEKILYEKGYCPLLSITIPGECDETVVER